MVVMQRDAEVPANQLRDALSGPQLIGPTVGLSAIAEQLLQLLLREG